MVVQLGVAQSKKAIVAYEETYHFEIPEQMKAMMPKDAPTKMENAKILEIVDNTSYFKPAPVAEEVPTISNGGGGGGFGQAGGRGNWMRRMGGSEEVFIDKAAKTQIAKANAFGKEFIVKDDFNRIKWRVIAAEQREILGYTCMKAEYRDSIQTTTVWFAPQLPMSFGPSGLHGLPGLILAASVGENRILLAKSIDLKAENLAIKPIEDKNSMTRAEFTKLVKERSEEMRKMFQSRRPGQ